MTPYQILASIWLGIVLALAIQFLVKQTDRHFWKGAGWGLLFATCVVITVLAINTLISGSPFL